MDVQANIPDGFLWVVVISGPANAGFLTEFQHRDAGLQRKDRPGGVTAGTPRSLIMWKRIRQWLRPPQFPEAEKTRVARAVHVFILATAICVLAPLWENVHLGAWAGVACVVFAEIAMLIAFCCNRQGAVTFAVYLLIGAFLVMTTLFMWTAGEGIHDDSLLVLPAVLVLASLVLNYRALILFTLAAIFCVAITVFSELNGWLVTPLSRFTSIQDLIDLLLKRLAEPCPNWVWL